MATQEASMNMADSDRLVTGPSALTTELLVGPNISMYHDGEYASSRYIWAVEVGSIYWQTSVCLIGGFLNLINFFIFVRRQFSSATYILMAALSIIDAATLFIRAPQGFVMCIDSWWCNSHRLYFYLYSLYVETPITNMTENMSVWLTVALALERYIALRHYNLSKTRCTSYNTRRVVCGIFCTAVIFNIPFFFTTHLNFEKDPETNLTVLFTNFTAFMESPAYDIYSWVRLFVVQLLPLVFLCVCNCLLLGLVYRHNRRFITRPSQQSSNNPIRRRSTSHNARKQRAQTKLTMLLVAVIFLFLFGQIPQAFAYHSIFKALGDCCQEDSYLLYRMVTQNLCLMAYSSTFFIYLGLNTHFRSVLCRLCYKEGVLANGTTLNQNNSDRNPSIPLRMSKTIAKDEILSKFPNHDIWSQFQNEHEICFIEEDDTLI